MVASSSREQTIVSNVKLSSVGPGKVTGPDETHEPTALDLAMKLHYLRGVYYFRSHEPFKTITIMQIKEAMFKWLNQFYVICGRLRRSESGRPYIKCNDCGVRIIEAQCSKTVEEWLEIIKDDNGSLQKLLSYAQPIGPELSFCPTVFVQVTSFKCGGISVGLSWAHVLGDAYFASEFMNIWGKIMAGHEPGAPPNLAQYGNIEIPPSTKKLHDDPLSLKWVDPVGDNWRAPSNNNKMDSFSFHVSATQLDQLQSKVSGPKNSDLFPPFESLCAVIWHCVAKIRNGSEPQVVTLLKYDPSKKNKGISNNNQVISIVKGEFSILESDVKELATLVTKRAVDECEKIKEVVEREDGQSSTIVYGANLTFVDLEDATFYELELKGQKPLHVSYMVDGIGDEGAVLVLPMAKGSSGGRFVTVTLPENELLELKYELKREWSIAN